MKQDTAILTRLLMLLATGGALASCGVRPLPRNPPAGNTGKFNVSSVDTVPRPSGQFKRYIPKPMGIDRIHLCTSIDTIPILTPDPFRRVGTWQRAAGDRVEWTVTSRTGFFPTYKSYHVHGCAFGDGKPRYLERFVFGKENQEYTVVVRNRSKDRLQIVVDADEPHAWRKNATVYKPGYLVEPHATIRIKGPQSGCRASDPFRFPSTGADKNLSPRVVGITVYTPWNISIDGIPADPDQFPPYR